MKLTSNYNILISSIENGRFTLDGYHIQNRNIPLDISNKQMVSLVGSPIVIGRSFIVSKNNLTTLEGGPVECEGDYVAYRNKLVNLKGCPHYVGGMFDCSFNNITTLDDIDDILIGRLFDLNLNAINNLHDIHKKIRFKSTISNSTLNLVSNPLKENILGVFLIPNLHNILWPSSHPIDQIKYPKLGDKAILYKIAQDLVKAGYPEMAKL